MFKNYFFKKLNFLPLHKSKALACIIEGLALYFDKIRQDIINTRNQYFIQMASDSLISDYGASRNITRSQYDTDEQFRSRVLNAFNWISLGGKEQGLMKILSDYGFPEAKFKNLRHENPELWAEFEFTYPTNLFIEDMKKIVEIINKYKPARSRLTKVNTPLQIAGSYYYAGIARHGCIIKIMVDNTIELNKINKIFYGGICLHPDKIKKEIKK